jgi:hypothetical protein
MTAGGEATIFYPAPAMKAWLKRWALTTGVSLTVLIERYCEEGRIRDELAEHAQQIDPHPDGLDQIRRGIRDGEDRRGPG